MQIPNKDDDSRLIKTSDEIIGVSEIDEDDFLTFITPHCGLDSTCESCQ
jgi:hypothetical protein